jgi:Mrp family chromosome partitioning ATPase
MEFLSNKTLDHRLKEFIRCSELRQLAHNIAALQLEKQFHSLAVLSFFPEEGKTLFCAAVAISYSETTGSKVLVVDTTTLQGRKSLALGDCFNGSAPRVDVMSLDQLRQHSKELVPSASDFSLIKQVGEDRSKQYGLVLLDTAPLHAKNRSNIDPLLAARLSGASVLVVSQKLLNAPKLTTLLKVLEDPSLHLIGVVSNEGSKR